MCGDREDKRRSNNDANIIEQTEAILRRPHSRTRT